MRRMSVVAGALFLLAVPAARAGAQSAATATSVAPPVRASRVACTTRALGAAGYRLQPHPSDSTRRVLARTLVGIDLYTGLLHPDDIREESVEVTVDEPAAAFSIARVSMAWPTNPFALPTTRQLRGLDTQARELLSAVSSRCQAR